MPLDPSPTPEPDPVSLALDPREGGIAWLTLGAGGARFVLGSSALELLDQRLDTVTEWIAEDRARALVVAGARPGTFVSGSDTDELQELSDAAQATRWALSGQRVLRRLEELPIPTIAAVDGICLEAGLELALACSYRLASDSATTRLGLPQVRAGLIPALGGTVRLPRLIGIQASLELLLSGRSVDPAEALRLGLVDEVLPASRFEEEVALFAENRIRGGRIRTGARRRVPRRLLEDTAPGRRLVFARAARRWVPALRPGSPAADQVLEAVAEGVGLPLEEAFRREAEIAGALIVSERARARLHALRLLREARRGPEGGPESAIHRVGILGAGSVGSEIAYLVTSGDIPVLLKDRRREALLRGARHSIELLRRDERDGAIGVQEADRREDLVSSATGFGGFGTLDLVVAAVGHGLEATEEALREAEEHTRPDCVLACCSLIISPTRLQQGMEHPERVVSLRFSRPSDLFPLLEIIPGEATSRRTLDVCQELARRVGRVPVVVPDRPDSPASRLLGILLSESLRLLEEGATVSQIDGAAEGLGLPLGPFRRMDALGVDRCVRVLRRLAEECGERMSPGGGVARLTGVPPLFYRYQKGLPRAPNPGLPAGIRAPAEEYLELIQTRLVLAVINEAARVAEELPELRAETIDIAALAGLGFPREWGGPLYHCDRTGAGRVVERLSALRERFGDRFAPAPLLLEMEVRGANFYGAAAGQRPSAMLR